MTAKEFSGHYPIERRAGEVERLRLQAEAMAPDAAAMLDRIGVSAGWRCLEIGCGPGGITSLMSERVGSSGRVVGLDMDAEFLELARSKAAPNTEFRQGDAYNSGLAPDSFDLVHMRFVASTAGQPERLIAEAKRLARPGGTVALQEPDGTTLKCYPPHPAWDTLQRVLMDTFAGVGADLALAHKLYAMLRASGLEDVQYRPFIVGVRSTDPMVDYLPSTVESLRGTVARLALIADAELDQALADCRAHLARPDTVFTMYTVAQVWGRKPG